MERRLGITGGVQQSVLDELFVREQHRAKLVCGGCPVRAECLAEALDNEMEWGVWGGMTERERRAILRKRPTERHLVAHAARDRDERSRRHRRGHRGMSNGRLTVRSLSTAR